MKIISITKPSTPNATTKFSTMVVSDEVFGSKANSQLLSQSIRVYLSNKRQGTSKVKTRGEVTGSRRKIWKQKGTGNARHGAKSAPIFVGGGVAHGPTGLENWTLKLSRTMKKKALILALSSQAANIFISENLEDLNGKTQAAASLINELKLTGKRILVLINGENQKINRAFNNIQRVNIMQDSLVNALDVASVDSIILSKEAVKSLEARLINKPKKKVVVEDTQKVSVKVTAKSAEKITEKVSAKVTKKIATKKEVKKAEKKVATKSEKKVVKELKTVSKKAVKKEVKTAKKAKKA